jgi:hypothetical protein
MLLITCSGAGLSQVFEGCVLRRMLPHAAWQCAACRLIVPIPLDCPTPAVAHYLKWLEAGCDLRCTTPAVARVLSDRKAPADAHCPVARAHLWSQHPAGCCSPPAVARAHLKWSEVGATRRMPLTACSGAGSRPQRLLEGARDPPSCLTPAVARSSQWL